MLERLEEALNRLSQFDLKLKPSKCKRFQSEVKCLGHIVSAEGIEPDSEKIASLQEWLLNPPKNGKQLHTFLGFDSYYRSFVYQFSKIAEPLRRLLAGAGHGKGKKRPRKNPPFVWTRECQDAFETLIAKLTSPPILAFPDFKLPFILHTDASG